MRSGLGNRLAGSTANPQAASPREFKPHYSNKQRTLFALFVAMFAAGLVLVVVGVVSTNLVVIPIAGLLVIGSGLLSIVLMFRILPWRNHVANPDRYDPARYKVFADSLQAVGIGAGVKPPELIVLDENTTNAFMCRFKGTPALALTPALLELDLTKAEVEGIMASCLALTLAEGIRSYDSIAPEGKGLIEDDTHALWWTGAPLVVKADSIAARITGQPSALREAIKKVDLTLRSEKRRRVRPTSRYMFVDPDDSYHGATIKQRLENLERIEA